MPQLLIIICEVSNAAVLFGFTSVEALRLAKICAEKYPHSRAIQRELYQRLENAFESAEDAGLLVGAPNPDVF